MKRWYPFLATLLIGGCSGEVKEGSATESDVPAIRTISTSAKVDPPNFDKRTSLRLIRKGEELRIGDSLESALRVFRPEPESYRISELPAGWKDPLYSCGGWDNGLQGFAAILFDNRVALGLYHEDRSSESRLQEILEVYNRMLDQPGNTVTGSRVRYWFWEQLPHRLMICAVQLPAEETVNITISLGDAKIMDIFGMNPLIADKDRKAAEKLFQDGLRARQTRKSS